MTTTRDRSDLDQPDEPRDDEQAFEAVFAAEYHGVVRVAAVICGSAAVAEEVAQEAFARAWRTWSSLERPAAYVQRLAINGAIDAHRRSGREARRDDRLRSAATTTDGAVPDRDPVDPLELVIDALPTHQRAAVLLRFYEDLSVPRIAELLDRPLNTVKSDLRRALAALSKELSR